MTTFNASIAASSDDAYQNASTVTLTGGSIGLYWSNDYWGFRFQNVTIPAGSTINSAKLTVTVTGTSDDTPNCTIYGEDVDDATTFTTASNNISGRTKTSASVSWPAADIGAGSKDSPDLKTIIQEIIDRAGWSSGNDLALLVYGSTTSVFAVRTYDYGSGIPSITIDYTAPGGGGAAVKFIHYARMRGIR